MQTTSQQFDKYTLSPGTKFTLVDDDNNTIYELVGYTTIGEHIIYVEEDWKQKYGTKNGAYDVTEAKNIDKIVSQPQPSLKE